MNKYLRFPALKAVYMYILWALIGSLRYFCAFWSADVTLSRESTSGEVQTLSYTNQWGTTLIFSHWCPFQHAQDTAGRREGTPNTPGSFNKGDTFESSQSFLQLYRRRARKNKVRIQKSVFFHVGWTGALSLCYVKHRRKISSRKNLDKQSYFVLSVYFYTLSILVSRVDALYIVVYKRTDVCLPRFACRLLCSFLSWGSTLCRTTS